MEKKRSSSSMYELLSVTELKPIKEIKDNKEGNLGYISTGNLNSLSSFLNSQSPLPIKNTGEIDYQNKIQIIKGDFYKDPEIIRKNCELFEPETIKNTVISHIVFNERQ